MRTLFILLLFLILSVSCNDCGNSLKEDPTIKKAIKNDADSMASALQKRDYEKFMSYTPDMIIESIGGEDDYLDYLDMMYEDFDANDIVIYEVNFGEIEQVVRKGGETQAILSQELILQTPSKLDTTRTTLLAVKKRSSDHWLFISPGDRSWDDMKKIYPYLHEELHWD